MYTSKHFSLSLPRGDGQSNVADLLRHLAKELDESAPLKILDIVFQSEMDDDGNEWPSFTVYVANESDS